MEYQSPQRKAVNDENNNDWGALPWMDMVLLEHSIRTAESLIHHWIWVDNDEAADWENNYRREWGYNDIFRNIYPAHMVV